MQELPLLRALWKGFLMMGGHIGQHDSYTHKSSTNTTVQHISATTKRLAPRHAATTPDTNATPPANMLEVAVRMLGTVITANVT